MKDIAQMLELMDRPALWVKDGIISAANRAALARQFPVGERIDPFLVTGGEEYRELKQGWLSLGLECSGERYEATVSNLEEGHIFALEARDTEEELRLLALTAQVQMVIPTGAQTVEVTTQVAMAESIIVGEVPETFTDVGNDMDMLDLVP